MEYDFLKIPLNFFENLNLIWTFVLLLVRFTCLMMVIPGIGTGMTGLFVRTPAIVVLAFSGLSSGVYAQVPADWGLLIGQMISESMFGTILGLIPLMIVTGVQTAGHLASTTMGLQASQLIDPTLHISIPDVARIYGDLVIVMFLIIGGHHIIVHAAAGMGGQIVPGTFLASVNSIDLLVAKSADIFRLGVLISAPVVVALLLTNFVMGLISKAVPTVNIFIISFPLTIGIGLILSILVIPEMVVVAKRELIGIEKSVLVVVQDTETESPRDLPR